MCMASAVVMKRRSSINIGIRRSDRIQRMLSAPEGALFRTYGRMVYDVPELLEAIAEELTWRSLVALGNSSKYAQDMMRRVVRRRIKYFVKPFVFHSHKVDAFFTLLRVTDAGIVGSLAWSVMAFVGGRSGPRYLNDLNIVVPNGGHRLWYWLQFLAKLGYTKITYLETWGTKDAVARRSLMFESEGRSITLTESRTSSIIPVVISSPLTSMMNVVTYWRIYCFLPSLFSRRISLETIDTEASSIDKLVLRNRGIKLHTLSSINRWDEACGQSCSGIWRRTKGLKGVGVARWGGIRGGLELDQSDIPSPEEELGRANIKWRIGYGCVNRKCHRYSLIWESYDAYRDRLF